MPILILAAALALLAQPTIAQTPLAETRGEREYADNVAFFERTLIGEVDVTPAAIFTDTRCADIRFCTRTNDFVISVILHEGKYLGDRQRELIMPIDFPVAVPGGYLVLRAAGTPPALNGAIPLREYRLGFEYVSLR